ncbi:MAG: tRNA epoxyqueuosine(34) reductase QueG [Saprospiraceae bacterium]|nr:tRNA epoxyqueuosine(34) reductase QueG [Saprospiraceae bacterium]MDP4809532.1 tRNA epoxyqueuosine(34) reductase QueG [Saprospiraceae bacterium]MDP4852634.1 tRNA epoxyqueuosine(34) reductase QueG [Saprospiraceae bacterium]MDP5049333.1 tRNA epoxyqueuosine(34) reductase QueG [Saprospiraceae bacterium]MDP5090582.1 tRNA epoxyqueuosine(34) reductase QueG [Saprospiraceae bacterium]
MNDYQFEQKNLIIEAAKKLGFSRIGFARASSLDQSAEKLTKWLEMGYHGEMKYMENHFDLRIDPRQLVPGAQTVIVLSFNYATKNIQKDKNAPKIAKYAFGKDYHKVLRKKLKSLFSSIQEICPNSQGRFFTDSAPILERDWAELAGLGWKGKNTLLIHPQAGSFFFLAEIIIDAELPYDSPMRDYCGSCRRCIDACPTDAIDKNGYLLDAKKCISYLTIELKSQIPEEFKDKMDNWVFGCDICQDVCPWNKFSTPHSEVNFLPKEELLDLSSEDWHALTEEKFTDLFESSAVKRTGFNGLSRNLSFIKTEFK